MENVICKVIYFLSNITPDTLIQLGLLIVAISALGTWRKQLYGGNSYQIAFDLILKVRQLEYKIQHNVRNPSLYPVKGKEYTDWNWERDVYAERFQEFYTFKERFYDESVLKAKILFGSDIEPLLEQVHTMVEEIWMAYRCAYSIYRGKNEYDDEHVYIIHQDKIEKDKEKLWNKNDDDYSKRLEKNVSELEQFLYKKIGK